MDTYYLDTGKKYIKDVFASDCFYNIPEYQRPYVWGEDQIFAILDDISHAMENDDKKEYFIGCMIWNSKKGINQLEYTYQDILDGQQRFITLYLLHAVIRDLSLNERLRSKVEERLRQEQDVFDGIPERNRIIFEIRDDKEFLENYVLTNSGTSKKDMLLKIAQNNDSTSVKNMAQALLAMHKWWGEKQKNKDSDDFQKYLNNFFTYMSNRVLVLYLATPNNLDDAYNLFTVLNSRGVQLQVSDILKAQNLRLIDNDNWRKSSAEKWSNFENTIAEPYKSFDEFLWALVFIKMKYRSDDNENLTKAFDFMFNKGLLLKGMGTFEFVEKYVEHYRLIISGNIKTSDSGQLFSNLITILNAVFGNQYMAPLMHYLECFGEYRIVDFLIKLDNLLSVHWLTGKRTLQTRIFIILRKMEELATRPVEKHISADEFLDSPVLRYDYDDENATTVLDINELFDMFRNELWGSFSGTKINKTRYLLLKLDLLMGNISTKLQFDRHLSSVEHILPQKPDTNQWFFSEELHQLVVHSLGNLALIDRKKNSSLSNSSFEKKKDIYKSAIEARANTNYIFMTYQEWNEATIEQNQNRILKLLEKYYLGNSLSTYLFIKSQKFTF